MKFTLSLKFIIGCILTLLVPLSATFYLINLGQERLIIRQAENEARAIFRQILLTRKWVADHGGVFVEKLPWVAPNPYLIDTESEIIDQEGKRYLRETPAMVTKELASYAREEGLYWFHITSLRLTNPDNAPDDFERQALHAFEQESAREYIAKETIGPDIYLRYISPLYVEHSCLPCHPAYRLNDVRGAISVTLPLSESFLAATKNRRILFVAMISMVVLLSGAMIFMMRHLVLTPMGKLSSAMQRFSEGRRNTGADGVLRTGDEFEELSRSFTGMAARLTEYHHGLEEKIRAATHDLEEINNKLLHANQLLVIANERKADFIASASHELRTPLTSIKGSMEYLTARLTQGGPAGAEGHSREELLDFFGLIRKNTDRLIRMVNTMLDLERIETGTASALTYSDFDLAALIRESVVDFSSRDNPEGIWFHVPGTSGLPVYADEDRIRQVVANLLDNAVKYAPPRSKITVHAVAESGFVTVEVTDQGPGIPEAERERIFDKFYKAGRKKGAGLGLAICRSIIEAHGGTIGVAASKGEGASLLFRIPAGRPRPHRFPGEGNEHG
jgi:signal transduction histidine kinase